MFSRKTKSKIKDYIAASTIIAVIVIIVWGFIAIAVWAEDMCEDGTRGACIVHSIIKTLGDDDD